MSSSLSQRREFFFLYDIRMGNPNGDPDENRPRRLPDGTFYVTDVRLKRFVRDWLKSQGHEILVDRPEDTPTNLTGRVQQFLASKPESVREECDQYETLLKKSKETEKPEWAKGKKAKKGKTVESPSADSSQGEDAHTEDEFQTEDGGDGPAGAKARKEASGHTWKAEAGRLVVSIILDAFIDARLFGSSLAFRDWDLEPRPRTLTGAVQMNMGEVIHRAQELDIDGTSMLASKEESLAGTFTKFFGLRYGLIGFNGIANEHSAAFSHLTDADYEWFLKALWKGVSSAPTANTRSKKCQVPRLLVDITYKPNSEFQFGCLLNYAKVRAEAKAETTIASPDDYVLDLTRLVTRLTHPCVQRVRYAVHSDIRHEPLAIPWEPWDLDQM